MASTNIPVAIIMSLLVTSSPALEAFSSKTSDASVSNDQQTGTDYLDLDTQYSKPVSEYSKLEPEFSKLEPQFSDTAYTSSGPAAALLPLGDKVYISGVIPGRLLCILG